MMLHSAAVLDVVLQDVEGNFMWREPGGSSGQDDWITGCQTVDRSQGERGDVAG